MHSIRIQEAGPVLCSRSNVQITKSFALAGLAYLFLAPWNQTIYTLPWFYCNVLVFALARCRQVYLRYHSFWKILPAPVWRVRLDILPGLYFSLQDYLLLWEWLCCTWAVLQSSARKVGFHFNTDSTEPWSRWFWLASHSLTSFNMILGKTMPAWCRFGALCWKQLNQLDQPTELAEFRAPCTQDLLSARDELQELSFF